MALALSAQPAIRRARPADRRAQILGAAARLFAEFGFETTSVRQIADAVEMLPGSLYHHFATKEDMLHAIMRPSLERLRAAHQAVAEMPGDAEQRLIASVVSRFQDSVSHWALHAILLNDSAFFRRREDFAYVQEAKAQSFGIQQAILIEGMRDGLFRPDIDVYMMIGTVARMLGSAADWFRSSAFHSASASEEYTLDRVVNFHVDCVLRLVRSSERLGQPVSLNLCRRVDLAGQEG